MALFLPPRVLDEAARAKLTAAGLTSLRFVVEVRNFIKRLGGRGDGWVAGGEPGVRGGGLAFADCFCT